MQSLLGLMYAFGQGVPQDYQEALRWYHLAAAQGDPQAQFYLGVAYYRGQGVPRDYQEAAKWYRLAADQGHSGAQVLLGDLYAEGKGVAQDYILAHMWFSLAGFAGDNLGAQHSHWIERLMTAEQIAEAQRLAGAWRPKAGR
jgi:hypothetical protein